MVNESVIGAVQAGLDKMKAARCSFADVRFYSEDLSQVLVLYDGNLESNDSQRERGIGIRVLKDGAWGFAATACLDRISACFEKALDNAKAASRLKGFPKEMGKASPVKGEYRSPVKIDPFDVSLTDKLAFLKGVDNSLKGTGIAQRIAYAVFSKRHIHYWNTEGSTIERFVNDTFAKMSVMTPDSAGHSHTRSLELFSDGTGTRGWEWLTSPEYFSGHAERLKQELASILSAPKTPPGKRDLIILPGQGFLQVHETIGHALELDRILGYELSYAGGSHVKPSDIGTLRYGSDKLNCRAGVVPNSPGTFGYDDEGTPQRDYMIIDKGILVDVISSRADLGEANAKAGKTVVTQSGTAARSCAFYRTPIDRMTNINIDPGTDGTLEDIIAATEDGLIVDTPVSWSIGSNREHFHFGTEIALEIKDGKKTRVLKKPTYQGHTLEFWAGLDKVGDASTWELQSVPNCGKGEPNQTMFLGHGIPVMRFRNVQCGERE